MAKGTDDDVRLHEWNPPKEVKTCLLFLVMLSVRCNTVGVHSAVGEACIRGVMLGESIRRTRKHLSLSRPDGRATLWPTAIAGHMSASSLPAFVKVVARDASVPRQGTEDAPAFFQSRPRRVLAVFSRKCRHNATRAEVRTRFYCLTRTYRRRRQEYL